MENNEHPPRIQRNEPRFSHLTTVIGAQVEITKMFRHGEFIRASLKLRVGWFGKQDSKFEFVELQRDVLILSLAVQVFSYPLMYSAWRIFKEWILSNKIETLRSFIPSSWKLILSSLLHPYIIHGSYWWMIDKLACQMLSSLIDIPLFSK